MFNFFILIINKCIFLGDVDITLFIDYDLAKGREDKDIVVPKKLNFDFDVIGNTHFSLTNLFNGNKELSKLF